jgi:uncharacterized protein with HEPN domain
LIEIGQAIKDLKNLFDFTFKVETKKFIKLRNSITHIYWQNKDLVSYKILKEELPKLKKELKEIKL